MLESVFIAQIAGLHAMLALSCHGTRQHVVTVCLLGTL